MMSSIKEMNPRNALIDRITLICGTSGQDGSYLAELLLKKGYTVIWTFRDVQRSSFANLQKLGIKAIELEGFNSRG